MRATISAVLLDAEGPHFSFGASVQEHLPEQVGEMLARFRGLLFALLDSEAGLLAQAQDEPHRPLPARL